MDNEKRKLLQVVERFARKKIVIWGDFILDEYIYGRTRRISREAPVLILSFQGKEFSLGGAGNSLLNLQSLGAEPIPVGVIGSDETGKKIVEILQQRRILTGCLLSEKKYLTPVKTRILAGEEHTRKQQILRIDYEKKVPENSRLQQKLLKNLKDLSKSAHALLISDYNYFTIREDTFSLALPFFKKAKIPVTLDSRFRLLNFKGITAATPNEPEAAEATNMIIDQDINTLKKAGRLILRKIQSSSLLITRGSKGMVLFERNKDPFFISIHGTTDIVDVTGAGDTVISVFTLALSCGASFRQASVLANLAGGIVVMKKGTATLTPSELKEAIHSKN